MTVTDLRFLQTSNPEADIELTSTKKWNEPKEESPFRGQEPNTHVAMRLDHPGCCRRP